MTTEAILTTEHLRIIADAVEHHTHASPHLAHMSWQWLPTEAYDHDYRDAKGRPVSRSKALTEDGDSRPGYAHHKTINDLGRDMIAEHERRLREINSPGWHKIVMERGR